MSNITGITVHPAAPAVAAQLAHAVTAATSEINALIQQARRNPFVPGCSVTGPAYGAWEEAATALANATKSITEALAGDSQSIGPALDRVVEADKAATRGFDRVNPKISVR